MNQHTLEWPERVKRYLKAELKRANVGYAELAKRLSERGMAETEASVTNKMARGTFTATFFVASLQAIGHDAVQLSHI
jgi:hypothetical protein